MMRLPQRLPGFNLIELIVTMGMVTLLSGVILVAVNPAYLFAKSRNTKRIAHLTELHKAINQYAADIGDYPAGITTVPKRIGTQSGPYMVDLTTPLQPYLQTIPFDPVRGSPADTYYTVFLNEGGNLVVAAPYAENKERIAIGSENKVIVFNGGVINLGNDTNTALDVNYYNATSNPNAEMTIEAWINLNASGTCNTNKVMPLITDQFNNNNQYHLEVVNGCHLRYWNTQGYNSGTIAYNVFSKNVNGTLSPNNGVWYHVAVTRKGTQPGSGEMILYVNGAQVARGHPSNTATYSSTLEVAMFGGNYNDYWRYSPPGPEFLGKMDEVRVYNRALSPEKIAERAQGLGFLDAPPQDGTAMAYFPFDENQQLGKVYDFGGQLLTNGSQLTGQLISNANPVSQVATNGDATINWSKEVVVPQ